VWDHSTFSQNQERLLASEVAKKFFSRIMEQAEIAGLLSDEHFTVDGTLIESWALLKSFRPKDDPPPSSPKGRNVVRRRGYDDEDIDEIAQYTYSIRILMAEVFHHAEEIDDLY
jgi:hypothetical protein